MTLTAGTRVGTFVVESLIGAGGMGEVYRARDTKLQRDVALKLLTSSLGTDADRLSRFTREAQLLAALNHPNIASIYSVDESEAGTVLVLELVEGPTLADRIAQGPLPVGEAIVVARQVAEALEAAHEQGIIHRDLKPANIKLKPDGTAKVLDFGLAKALSPAMTGMGSAGATNSPTFTQHATAGGLILGTVAYMAPEQARGLPVDRRADIWAFGVVLFEMLSGRRPFGGATVTDTLAAIIKDPPAWSKLPSRTPAGLQPLLRRLLEKDPRRRLRDIGDARLMLEEPEQGGGDTTAPPAGRRPSVLSRVLPWSLAAIATVAAVALGLRSTPPPGPERPTRKYILPITGESLERVTLPTLSPDGRKVAFVKGGSLWIRSLDQLEPRAISGTEGAQYPFWSPDSLQVAYLTATALWRVGVAGAQPVRVATSHFSKGGRTPGGAWLDDGTIVFAPSATGSGLLAVSAQGGEFKTFYTQDAKIEGDLHRPSVLPDGRSLVFVVDRLDTGADTIGILASGARKDIFRLEKEILDSPVYSPTGHIVFHRETTSPGIWAIPFSAIRLEATGEPFLVVPQGSYPNVGADGTLIYGESGLSGLNSLVWLDIGTGAVTSAFNEQFPSIGQPRLSPTGRQVAAVVQLPDLGSVVIVADLQRHTHIRLGDRVGSNSRPTWRDDRTVIYARDQGGPGNAIVMRAADGSGPESLLTTGMHPNVSGRRLVFTRLHAGRGGDLHQLLLAPGGPPAATDEPFQQGPSHEWEPALSPSGTLLLYTNGDPGQSEVILRSFPTETGRWQISSNGGSWPLWSPKGDAIYYRDVPGQIMRVGVHSGASLDLDTPRPVMRPSSLLARVGFDISSDGKRLLMVQEVKSAERPPSLAVVHNWFSEFRK